MIFAETPRGARFSATSPARGFMAASLLRGRAVRARYGLDGLAAIPLDERLGEISSPSTFLVCESGQIRALTKEAPSPDRGAPLAEPFGK